MAVLQTGRFQGEKWDEPRDPEKWYWGAKGVRLVHKLIYTVEEIGRPAVDKIKEILDEGPEEVDVIDMDRWTPLMYACWISSIDNYRIEIIRLLIDRGCNLDHKNIYGNTVLDIAVKSGRVNVVQLLIDNGADLDLKNAEGCTSYDQGNDAIKEIIRNAPNNPVRQQALLRKTQPPPPDDDFLTIDI